MKKITDYGYNVEETKTVEIQMGTLKLHIIQLLTEKNADIKIKINMVTYAEVTEYENLREFILSDVNNSYGIKVLNLRIVHMNKENEDVLIATIEEID